MIIWFSYISSPLIVTTWNLYHSRALKLTITIQILLSISYKQDAKSFVFN